jgi:FlaA1/EpsC-like NDP-sugar epimerase
MGSRGSVIPLFQEQIAKGGPLTVTHPDVVRYFMTISEAVQLVLCAGTLANHGEVFVLDMGSPRKILDMANEMVILSGLQPGKDIEISITGLRPGEKLREELTCASEHIRPTKFEKLSLVIPEILDQEAFLRGFSLLAKAAQKNDSEKIYEILAKMGFGFQPRRQLLEGLTQRPAASVRRQPSGMVPVAPPQ